MRISKESRGLVGRWTYFGNGYRVLQCDDMLSTAVMYGAQQYARVLRDAQELFMLVSRWHEYKWFCSFGKYIIPKLGGTPNRQDGRRLSCVGKRIEERQQ